MAKKHFSEVRSPSLPSHAKCSNNLEPGTLRIFEPVNKMLTETHAPCALIRAYLLLVTALGPDHWF